MRYGYGVTTSFTPRGSITNVYHHPNPSFAFFALFFSMPRTYAHTHTFALFNCLIRTHHITSRKKVQRVKKAARQLNVDWVLIRSGGSPGIMFAESRDENSLSEWVAFVQNLRYKDFQCPRKPSSALTCSKLLATGFDETESISEFAKAMESRGLRDWWKKAMGYENDD